MKIVMIIFGIFFLLQGLVVLKNKRYGPEEPLIVGRSMDKSRPDRLVGARSDIRRSGVDRAFYLR